MTTAPTNEMLADDKLELIEQIIKAGKDDCLPSDAIISNITVSLCLPRLSATTSARDVLWTKKRKGCADIYTAPGIDHAVVDNRGFGHNPGVNWNGQEFSSVDEAKAAALSNLDAAAPAAGGDEIPAGYGRVTNDTSRSGDILRYEIDEETRVGKVTDHFRPLKAPAHSDAVRDREIALENIRLRQALSDAAKVPSDYTVLGYVSDIGCFNCFERISDRISEIASAALAPVAKAPAVSEVDVGRIRPAIDALTNGQEQCDEDGVMVRVSRQALVEVLVFIQSAAQGGETEGGEG